MRWAVSMPDQRSGNIGESTVTVRWWAVMMVIIGIFGFFFLSMLNHEGRLTKVETQFSYITDALTDLKGVTKEIREDQIRRYEKEMRVGNHGKP